MNGLSYKRGLIVLAAGLLVLASPGCGLTPVKVVEETAAESEGSERELSLEDMDSKAEEYEGASESEPSPDKEVPDIGSENEGSSGEASAEESETDAENKVLAEAVISPDGSCEYAYNSLSETERIWYSDMVEILGTMTDKVKLSESGLKSGLDEKDIDKIFQCVQSDHPEFFYVEGYTYTKYTRAGKTFAIEFSGSYALDRENVLKRKGQIETAAGKILAGVPKGADDYTKVKYVYETLIFQTDYDLNSKDNQNMYSVFINHSSVCQGYAKAAQYLLNQMGIECALVQGLVLETGETHAWNLVKMDGQYYYIDVTWGDVSYRGTNEQLAQISYDYLGVTTAQIRRTHKIEGVVPMPSCTAKKDNYYVREGALFADYDKEKLQGVIDRALEQQRGDVTVQCDSEECFQKMYGTLVEQQEIFDYFQGKDAQVFAYTTSDKQLTLTFFMMTSAQ